MKKPILFLSLTILIMFTLITPLQPVQAWGPNTHVVITKRALNRADADGIVVALIKAHPDAFYCGLLFPDIAVLYYYTQFESYKSTHNWLFYRRLIEEAKTDEERVFAYGVAVHLIQDSVAHNSYIPYKIKQTLGSNLYTHPLVEASVEAKHIDLTTSGSLEVVDKFLPLAQKVLGRDVSEMTFLFRDIIRAGTFYDDAYAPPDIPLWDLYGSASAVAQRLYGVDDVEPYLDEAVSLTVEFMDRGETPLLDPTGIDALKAAGSHSRLSQFSFVFVISLLIFTFHYRRRRS